MERQFIEGNRLIATFLGFKKSGYLWMTIFSNVGIYPKVIFEGDNTDSFKFHSSYDWLMPVIHKCWDDTTEEERAFKGLTLFELSLTTPIEELWTAVVEFIEWKNQQSENK